MECFIFWVSCKSKHLASAQDFIFSCLLSIFLCCLFTTRSITPRLLVFLQAILPYSQALEKFAPHIQQACIPQHSACTFFLRSCFLNVCIPSSFNKFRLAWKVMARVSQLMGSHYLSRLVKLTLVSQEQTVSTASTN